MGEYITPISDQDAIRLGILTDEEVSKNGAKNPVSINDDSENIYDVIAPKESRSMHSIGVQKDDNEMFSKKRSLRKFELELVRIEVMRQNMSRYTSKDTVCLWINSGHGGRVSSGGCGEVLFFTNYRYCSRIQHNANKAG